MAVTPPLIAARKAEETRETVQRLTGAACVEFAGVAHSDLPRAREAFAAFKLGDRLVERRVEDITRHWVFMPAAKDRRAAEVNMATLRKKGVTDMSIRPDNAISLGVFSTEEAARRYLVDRRGEGRARARNRRRSPRSCARSPSSCASPTPKWSRASPSSSATTPAPSFAPSPAPRAARPNPSKIGVSHFFGTTFGRSSDRLGTSRSRDRGEVG